jgi:hypothetical protein
MRREENQLDVTECFIALMIRSETICVLLPPMVCSAWLLVVGGQGVTATVRESARKCWSRARALIRAQAKDAYYREQTLDKRINHIQEYLLAKIWYLTQIYPHPEESVRQLSTPISWFIRKGQIFWVPMSTLHKKKKDRGWDLINMKAKGRALFLHRMRTQSQGSGTVTSEWRRSWDLESQSNNPPCRDGIPPALQYLRRYSMDAAYVPLQGTQSHYRHIRDEYMTRCTQCSGQSQGPKKCA